MSVETMKSLVAGCCVYSGLTAVVTAPVASAQESEGNLPTVTIVGKSVMDIDEPSTAGSRLGLTPLETPASVAIVDGDLIRGIGTPTVLEAKSLAVGIGTSNSPGCGGNTVSGRGFYGANSVKQLYDGMEIYNAGCVVSFPTDPWNVERIEVLYGPASVLYGSGAIGGAINVVPKRPTAMPSTDVLFSYGSFNTWQAALGSTGALTERLSYRIDVSRRTSDSWVDRGEFDSTAVSGSLRFQVNDDLSFTLSNDFGDQNPSDYLGTPLGPDGKPVKQLRYKNYNVADAEVYFTDNRTTITTEWSPAPNVELTNNAYAMWHDRRYHDVYNFRYNAAAGTVTRSTYRDIDDTYEWQYGDTGHMTFSNTLFGAKNRALAGWDINRIYYHRNDTSRGGSTTVDAIDFDPGFYSDGYSIYSTPFYRMNVQQFGAFAEDRLELRDDLSVVAGLRYDLYDVERYDNRTGVTTRSDYKAPGWNVGVVYKPVELLSVYAQYAVASDPVNSFASIGASEQSFHLSDGRQIEIGVKQSFMNGRGEWTLAAYDIVKKDLLTTSLIDPTLTEQVGRQSSRGFEATAALAAGNWLFKINGTVLKAKYDKYVTTVGGLATSLAGNVPTNVPEKGANLMVFWKLLPEWQLRSTYQYVGESFADSTNRSVIGKKSAVNFGLSWQTSAKTKLDLRLDNAFDEIYPTWGSTTQWMLGAPRSVTLSANINL